MRYLPLDCQNDPEGTVKALEVPVSETEPFISGLWVLSYIAYPEPDETFERDAFFEAMKFQWQIRHVDPKLTRKFVEKKYRNTLAKAGKRVTQRASAGRIALFQIFKLRGPPTVKDQAPAERILLGWSKDATESDSTYKSKVWGPSRPVLHLATALVYTQAFNNNIYLTKLVFQLLADPLALVGFLELAENLRRGLPSINTMYSLDQFVRLYIGQPISIDPFSRSNLRRPPNQFGPNPSGRWSQGSPR